VVSVISLASNLAMGLTGGRHTAMDARLKRAPEEISE
jgi:hypothetical protein